MILTIDIGNTDITAVLYSKAGQYLHEFRAATKSRRTMDELGLALYSFLSYNKISSKEISGAIISSVVPAVNSITETACERYLGIKPLFLNSSLKIPLTIKTDSPSALGKDIVATSVGAIARYGNGLIVFNFGTATVCNVIGDENDYLGCMIAAGINTSINALQREAALLPEYRFQKPIKIPATSTNEALYAGIFYNTLGMIEKMTEEVKTALGQYKFKVIATGGFSSLIKGHTNVIDSYDSDLTTFGLYKIYLENKHDI